MKVDKIKNLKPLVKDINLRSFYNVDKGIGSSCFLKFKLSFERYFEYS